jgi:hypothetical protein
MHGQLVKCHTLKIEENVIYSMGLTAAEDGTMSTLVGQAVVISLL